MILCFVSDLTRGLSRDSFVSRELSFQIVDRSCCILLRKDFGGKRERNVHRVRPRERRSKCWRIRQLTARGRIFRERYFHHRRSFDYRILNLLVYLLAFYQRQRGLHGLQLRETEAGPHIGELSIHQRHSISFLYGAAVESNRGTEHGNPRHGHSGFVPG